MLKSTDYLQINCPAPVQADVSKLNQKYGFGKGVTDLFYDLKNYGNCRLYSQERIFETAAILCREGLKFSIITWQ